MPGEDRDAAEYPTMHRTVSKIKDYPVPALKLRNTPVERREEEKGRSSYSYLNPVQLWYVVGLCLE